MHLGGDNFLFPVTVGEAISDLPIIEAGEGFEEQDYDIPPLNDYQRWIRYNSDRIYNHVAMQHSDRLVERYKMIQNGKKLEELPSEYKVRRRGNSSSVSSVKFDLNYRILHANKASLTIPASFYSSFIHPFQPRNITAREAARLQSFPDNYIFYGKRTLVSNSLLQKKGITPRLSQYNQIGNAVPPLLAKAIAEKMISLL